MAFHAALSHSLDEWASEQDEDAFRDLEPGDVAVVPFPFTERPGTKKRPALVLSQGAFNRGAGRTVLAMITTKRTPVWPGDVPIEDIESAGLPDRCSVRLKLFTLDNRLILRRAGWSSAGDRARVAASLAACLQPPPPATGKKKAK